MRDRRRSRPDPLTDAVAYFRDLGVAELHLRRPATPADPAPLPLSRGPAASPPADPAQALPTLEELSRRVAACERCPLHRTRTQTVFSDGSPAARLMFVGEAPGADEDAQGAPFVGRAGQLLTRMIEAGMGLSRRDVYIANVLKCRPPDNRNPEPAEIASCRGYLEAQIAIVRPQVIVALGKFAAQFLLETEEGIMKLRGRWGTWRGVPVMPTFHPSFLLRQPDRKRDAWADLLEVLKKLGLPAPPTAR